MKMVSTVLTIIAVVVIGYFSLMSYLSSQMSESSIDTWKAMKSGNFDCPEGMEEKTERWSKLGYSRSCVKPKHGKWEAWSEGYKHIDGFYNHGKKEGVWVFYNSDGSISKKVEYKEDREVSANAGVKDGSE